MSARTHEIVIVGAGPIGLATAIAARRQLGKRHRILVCDPRLREKQRLIRTYAISHAPRRVLDHIGVWPMLGDVQPIYRMEITDSALTDIVRQRYLTFDSQSESAELAFMVTHEDLMRALWDVAASSDIEYRDAAVGKVHNAPENITIDLTNGESIKAALAIGCDGGGSPLRDLMHIAVSGWSYDRTAIVATVAAENAHEGTAVQHFLPAGTFALLPLTGQRFSIVWVETPEDARLLCTLSPRDFTQELQMRAGNAFGELKLIEGPQTFPLKLQIARHATSGRAVLVGDAAHLMHPLAGQGLNLGLADIAFLIEALSDDVLLGSDLGSAAALKRYESSRYADTASMLGLTDMLFRLFTSTAAPVRHLRDTGLGMIEKAPALKRRMISEAGGRRRSLPELLR